jgi:hypothetical protein
MEVLLYDTNLLSQFIFVALAFAKLQRSKVAPFNCNTFLNSPIGGLGVNKKPRQTFVGVLNIIQKVLAMPLQSPNGVCMPPPIFVCYLIHCPTNMRDYLLINKFFLKRGLLA